MKHASIGIRADQTWLSAELSAGLRKGDRSGCKKARETKRRLEPCHEGRPSSSYQFANLFMKPWDAAEHGDGRRRDARTVVNRRALSSPVSDA